MTKKEKEILRHYKVAHQILSLTGINFQTKSIIGCVELTLIPSRDNLKHIRLNAKQLRIYSVCLNNSIEASFQYFDPTLEVCQQNVERRDLDTFGENHLSGCNLVDPDCNGGELNIKIPSEAFNQNMIAEGKPLKVRVEFSLEDPLGGVHFVVPEGEGTLADRSAHLYTYAHENSARLWFPCVDTNSEPCTWKLEFTVDECMTAISAGELYDTVYTQDMRRKTYHYQVNTPTAPPNIVLVVGPFQPYVDPNMHEVTHFCLPHLLPVLKSTVRHLHEVFEYFETILGTQFPFNNYKQVFVDELYPDICSYSSLTLFNTNILHPTSVIDQQYETRKMLAEALATQFFGCYVSTEKWSDRWIRKGIPKYLMSLWVKKTFGNNEYRDMIHQSMYDVVDYENKYGGIILDSSQVPAAVVTIKGESSRNPEVEANAFCFPVSNLQTCSPEYLEVMEKKAHLVVRMLEHRLGQQQFLQVLNKLLALASNARTAKADSRAWQSMVWNTNTFTKSIFSVTGKDMVVFMDQWVRMGGHAKFSLKFIFNRKRNTVELEINQDAANNHEIGVRKYVGPVKVALQELDGQFPHTFQVERVNSKHDITCHSKSRRNKKKKIPLVNNEEVDMDLSQMDDSPVLWIRLDPDFTLIRSVEITQPDFQWQYQLRHERDVTAQTEAVYALEAFPSKTTRKALSDIIKNEHCFYKVRCRATTCLRKVYNAMVQTWEGHPAMMSIFKAMFGSFAAGHIIKQNDFSSLQNYFLQCAIPMAMAGLRSTHGICPNEVLEFLLNLFKYNDNSKNSFSDNYYRAALVTALGETVTPVVSMLAQEGPMTSESLAEDTKKVLEEITRYLNMDKLLPCYRYTVTVACLKAIRKLQKTGHLPPNQDFFRDYAKHGQYHDVRLAALECLVDYVRYEGRFDDLLYVLEIVEKDVDPGVRHKLCRMLIKNPPFERGRNHRNDRLDLVEHLWKLINNKLWYDSRLRCDLVDLYYTLYGRRKPYCLPIPELAALGRAAGNMGMGPSIASGGPLGSQWSKKSQFVIPKAEKKEIKTEIKTEPGIQIKQEIDDRSHIMAGMEVPDFLMEGTPNANFMPPLPGMGMHQFPGLPQFPAMPPTKGESSLTLPDPDHSRKRKKEKKKKKKHKHKKEDRKEDDNTRDSTTKSLGGGGSSAGSSSGSAPNSPLGFELAF